MVGEKSVVSVPTVECGAGLGVPGRGGVWPVLNGSAPWEWERCWAVPHSELTEN